jgi:hypothetical protein
MKTPREIFLARHEAAESKLDAVRRNALAAIKADEKSVPGLSHFFVALREFFAMPRAVGAGFAATWLVIIALNLAAREVSSTTTTTLAKARPSSETLQALREQRRLFVELTGSVVPRDAEPPRTPRPRSQGKPEFIFA